MQKAKDVEIALKLRLISPAGAQALEFTLSNSGSAACTKTALEMFTVVKHVSEDIPEMAERLKLQLKRFDAANFCSVTRFVCRYNEQLVNVMERRKERGEDRPIRGRAVSTVLLKFILEKCHEVAVASRSPMKYKAFSPEVYGEVTFELVEQIIYNLTFTEEDVFVDLGSGVGQVVLHVAAATCCKLCWGVEKSPQCAHYATNMCREFKKWMNWFGKECLSPFKLEEGNFLLPDVQERLKKCATVIFINNFSFGSVVNHALTECFKCLREGTRIISGEPLVPPKFRRNSRTQRDFGSIVRTTRLSPFSGSVSWTNSRVGFCVHTIERALREIDSTGENQCGTEGQKQDYCLKKQRTNE